ncbi:MAG: M20/M25/M40 family metallo-hydrolase [Flavobacteriales bacterium]|nr:M20/M25/M40 family metallo-hydrolase [Flavobacteriales bacterium]
MKKLLTLTALSLTFSVRAQDPVVAAIVDAVDIDSMMLYVREIAGEMPVDLGSGEITIETRHKLDPGNSLAQTYLEQKLTGWGYDVSAQEFSATGRNVLATKLGYVHPEEVVILCAHYDTFVSSPFLAPAADDDGSGCGALLEAARILRDIPFEYTVVLAFWDEEEQGKVGSIYYASHAAGDDAVIKGVVNMDAIAYDGNGDTKARVHARPTAANSSAIADTVFAVLDRYEIDIDLLLTTPGAVYSDHASFWSSGYGAVLIIEEFTGDANPYYHTPNDLTEHFDIPYFQKLAQLSIGSIATLAVPFDPTAAVPDAAQDKGRDLSIFPNPSQAEATLLIHGAHSGTMRVSMSNALGQVVAVLGGTFNNGLQQVQLPLAELPGGAYTVTVSDASNWTASTRVISVR